MAAAHLWVSSGKQKRAGGWQPNILQDGRARDSQTKGYWGTEEEVAHHSAESGDEDELENEEEMTDRKKKQAKLALKDFVEEERWDRLKMIDTDILAHIREMIKLEQFQFEQFQRGEVVCFVLVVFCFVIALSSSWKRKSRFVALPEQFQHSCLS